MRNRLFFSMLFILTIHYSGAVTAPESVHREGRYILQSGDYQRSIAFHLSALNRYPDDAVMIYNLASAYLYTGKRHEAEKYLIQILKDDDTHKNARAMLYSLYTSHIESAIRQKNYNLAFDYVNKGLYYLRDNSNFEALNGQLYLLIGSYFQSAEAYKKSWEMDYQKTESVINHWKLKRAGEAYARTGKTGISEWKSYMESLLRKNPDSKEILNLTAEAYFFADENPQKRNKLRNKAMDLYRKENPLRFIPEVAYPLEGSYEIASGYFEWNLDTHNGYDGYCLDLVALDEQGKRYTSGSGLYYSHSFGKPVYAAADGIVESAIDIHEDNPIGTTSYFTPNLVRIRHSENGYVYYTIYYHIKKNSLAVRSGDRVKTGELLASIGNSGYSFGPHLHFGVYDAYNVSLPVRFKNTSSKNITYKHGMKLECVLHRETEAEETIF